MKKSLLGGLMLAVMVAPLALAGDGQDKWASHKGKLDFVVGYENAVKEAKFSGRPMMVFFTTTW